MNPSSELISEFKVVQFNNNAEFSQTGDVTIFTKSGANSFHGSAFEYLQNSALDAPTTVSTARRTKHTTRLAELQRPARLPPVKGQG